MEHQVFDNVWDALEEGPAEAANMTLRSDLLAKVRQQVQSWDVPRLEAARRLDISPLRLSELLNGRIGRFSLDALVLLASRAGFNVTLQLKAAA